MATPSARHRFAKGTLRRPIRRVRLPGRTESNYPWRVLARAELLCQRGCHGEETATCACLGYVYAQNPSRRSHRLGLLRGRCKDDHMAWACEKLKELEPEAPDERLFQIGPQANPVDPSNWARASRESLSGPVSRRISHPQPPPAVAGTRACVGHYSAVGARRQAPPCAHVLNVAIHTQESPVLQSAR
jgi:hypothetical protein